MLDDEVEDDKRGRVPAGEVGVEPVAAWASVRGKPSRM